MPFKHDDILNDFIMIKNVVKKRIDITKTKFKSIHENDLYRFYQDSLKKYLLSMPGPRQVLKGNNFCYKEDLFNNDDFNKICDELTSFIQKEYYS